MANTCSPCRSRISRRPSMYASSATALSTSKWSAAAGDLDAVVAPRRREPAHLLEREVSPLAGEQRDGAGHRSSRVAAVRRSCQVPDVRSRRKCSPSTGQVVLAGRERAPDRRRGRDRVVVGGERLDAQRAGVAGAVERVRGSPASRGGRCPGAPRSLRADLHPGDVLPGEGDGLGDGALLDVLVVGVEQDPAPGSEQRPERLERLLDGVEDAGLVAVQRLDGDGHVGRHGVLDDRREVLAQLVVHRGPLAVGHPPGAAHRRVGGAADDPCAHRRRDVDAVPQVVLGAAHGGGVGRHQLTPR